MKNFVEIRINKETGLVKALWIENGLTKYPNPENYVYVFSKSEATDIKNKLVILLNKLKEPVHIC